MININLLPWRERIRKKKIRNFIILIGAGVFAAILGVAIFHLHYRARLQTQLARNTFLQTEIDQQAAKITGLNRKKKLQSKINTDLKLIFDMKEKSYQAVEILDEIARLAPEAISLIRINRQGNTLLITGQAKSDSEITVFLRKISDSALFEQPNLTQITAREDEDGQAREFEIQVECKVSHEIKTQ